MWCCLEMAGPESQSSSAGAGFTRVEEADSSLFLADLAHIERMQSVVFLFVFLKLG